MGAHGPFSVEVSSAKKYGLLASAKDGLIEPSRLAKTILRPQNPQDELLAYREAVSKAPDISEVYQHYRGENLPDKKFFENTVVETFGIPREKVAEFQDVFVATLKKAELLSDRDGKIRILDVAQDADTGSQKSDRMRKLEKGVSVNANDTCFVMQTFASPLGEYYESVYKPAIQKAGFNPVRADADIFGTGKIMDQVWTGISAARVLVAELTSRNPNVFYELGLAHALKKPVVLVSANENDVPFDLQHIRVVYYDVNDPFWGKKLLDKVAENILSAVRNPDEAIFQGTEPNASNL